MQIHVWWVLTASFWLLQWVAIANGLECREEPETETKRCIAHPTEGTKTTFYVDGDKLIVGFQDSDFFSMECHGNLTLDNPALPCFASTQYVKELTFHNCPAPAISYAEVLRSINLVVLERLEIKKVGSEIERKHLVGLQCLDGTGHCDSHRLQALALVNLRLGLHVFEAVPKLLRLRLENTKQFNSEQLPTSLNELHLLNADVEHLSRSALSRLTKLKVLTVRDDHGPVKVDATVPIKLLSLEANSATIDASLPSTLTHLTLRAWNESFPEKFTSCGALQFLYVEAFTAEFLPDDWLTNCTSLAKLTLKDAPLLTNVSSYALTGAGALETLKLNGSSLKTLPARLLRDTTNLKYVTLSNNKLESLPRWLFSTTKVETLNLSHNNLTGEVLNLLGTAERLRELTLSDNPRIGDACPQDYSHLREKLKDKNVLKLKKLFLRNINSSVVCGDWTHLVSLQELDLSNNRIQNLTFLDLKFEGQVGREVRVDLSDNPVHRLLYTRQQYQELMAAPRTYCRNDTRFSFRARVSLKGTLQCDCHSLWAARALRDCPAHVRIDARCAHGALDTVPEVELTCPVPPGECGEPADCTCARRDADLYTGEVRRVTCRNRTTVPRVQSTPRVYWELRLQHNHIAHVAAQDLPDNLLELDLRSNKLTQLAPEVVRRLPAGARLSVGGNLLRCSCELASALHGLQVDATELRACAAQCVAPAPRSGSVVPVGALAALGALAGCAALLAAWLATSRVRRRLKGVLRGARPHALAALPYDVFLSYSHHDRRVAARLLQWLEARRYRVCEHSRDWAPGGWIPAQIAASVRRSRCTLVLVSRHFLRSKWARAEFREAYVVALGDERPRLLVVLLEEPDRLQLDGELRRYVHNNTYALWDDAFFWRKLKTALPPPPPPAAPPQREANPAQEDTAASSSELASILHQPTEPAS